MNPAALDGVRIVAFEARRADEMAKLFARHGASLVSAPALREAQLPERGPTQALIDHFDRGDLGAVILLTGVGTRAMAAAAGDAAPRLLDGLRRVPVVARGPKPLAALRELDVAGARPVPAPHTWREALAVLDGLSLPPGSLVAVQEYGAPPTALLDAIAARGLRALRVPVYRWALPEDVGPLHRAAAGLVAGALDVAVFTSAVQVAHLFRIAPDAEALRAALNRIVVASIGPVCSEAIDGHGVRVTLEASPPKLGPLVALVADRAPALVRPAHPNVARIRALFDAFRAGDVDAIRAAFAPDATWHFPGRRGALAGDHTGHDAILAFLGRVLALTEGTFRLNVEGVLADDREGVVFFRGHGRRPDGRVLDNPTCLRIRFAGGRAVEVHEFVWDLEHVEAFWADGG